MSVREYSFVVACFFFLGSACKKSQIDLLPHVTTNGSNTFGCLIDGKAFIAQGYRSPGLFGTGYSATDGAYYSPGHYWVSGFKRIGDNNDRVVISLFSLFSNGKFLAGGNSKNTITYDSPDYARTDSVHMGSINILQLNSGNNIVSGTFEASLQTNGGKIIKISDGRFDVVIKYFSSLPTKSGLTTSAGFKKLL